MFKKYPVWQKYIPETHIIHLQQKSSRNTQFVRIPEIHSFHSRKTLFTKTRFQIFVICENRVSEIRNLSDFRDTYIPFQKNTTYPKTLPDICHLRQPCFRHTQFVHRQMVMQVSSVNTLYLNSSTEMSPVKDFFLLWCLNGFLLQTLKNGQKTNKSTNRPTNFNIVG